jgi:integrase/recombinase XerD
MLKRAVNTYIDVRRAAGLQLRTTEDYLRDFTRFAMARGDTHVVAQTAIAWAARGTSEAQRHNRLMTLRRFVRFMHAEDRRHELPPNDVFCGWRQRPTPYIFHEEEIQRIVARARQLGPPGSLRPETYSTLFGLLAATGMRASEARALHLPDVTPDGLMIRESKFKKSRMVPLHDTTRDMLEHYLKRRCRQAGAAPHLFVSLRGRKLSRTAVVETFHQVLKSLGIPETPGRPRPRLMDLRHTFAVRALETCPEGRDHVGRHILALTTYMGHAKVESTFWYLESTPELMADIAQCTEAFVYGGGQ